MDLDAEKIEEKVKESSWAERQILSIVYRLNRKVQLVRLRTGKYLEGKSVRMETRKVRNVRT